MAAIHYLYKRMNTYRLSLEKRQKENINIEQILKNNGYNSTIPENVFRREKPKQKQDKNKTQWAKFLLL